MRIHNQRDFWAGIMFLVIGCTFMVLSAQYQVGSAAKMGPGYFPLALGGLMAFLGLLIALSGLRRTPNGQDVKLNSVGWKELILVLVAVALFAALLNTMGVVLALTAMIIVASLASHEFHWLATVLICVVLCVMAWAIFVVGLELQFSVWPTFLSK